VLLLKHQPTGVDIDLSFGALPFEEELIARAIRLNLGALRLKISTPEDLIIMKAIAQRPKDLADIDAIVQTVERIDEERVKYWVQQFADALEMPELMKNIQRLLPIHKSPAQGAKKKKASTKRKK
jgi:predicted nucleotidyltransferase